MYYSAYSGGYLNSLALAIREASATQVWCIFDNTASGAAAENALELMQIVEALRE
jgi:uncharacterized protein YecE (DUF72 family)